MAKVKPGKPITTVNNTAQGLEITIPTKKNLFLILFLSVWSIGWIFGEAFAATAVLFSESPPFEQTFLLVWLLFWTIGGITVAFVLLWQLAGKERVVIDYNSIVIRREIFQFGIEKEYDKSHVKNIRLSPPSFNPMDFKSSFQFFGLGGGIIAFDYGAKTVRFGGSIEEGEAHMLLEKIDRKV